jgi:hypothetical protein
VTPGVVDLLEVIEVGHDDAEAEPGPAEDVELFVQKRIDVAPVGQGRERVLLGKVAQPTIGHLERHGGAGVAKNLHPALDLAVLAADRHHVSIHGDAPAILVAQVHAVVDRFPRVDRAHDRAVLAALVAAMALVKVVEVPVAEAAHDLVAAKPADALGALVPVENAPFDVDEVDTVVEVVEQPLEEVRPEGVFPRQERARNPPVSGLGGHGSTPRSQLRWRTSSPETAPATDVSTTEA